MVSRLVQGLAQAPQAQAQVRGMRDLAVQIQVLQATKDLAQGLARQAHGLVAAEALDRRATVLLDTEVQDMKVLATEALQAITFHHSIHPSPIHSSKSVSPSSGTGAPGSIVLPSGTGHSHPSHPASRTGNSRSGLPSITPTATQAAPEPTLFLEIRLQSKKVRGADNTTDTTVQYINVVADESFAYDELKFVDTQDAATPLSLSAEGYLETTAGTINDLEIAGLKDSDDAIRLHPNDIETTYDLATCAITAGVFSREEQGTTGFYVCSDFDRLLLGPVPVGREALCRAVVINATAADGGSGTTTTTTASGIFPTGTGSYPSGTGSYPSGTGVYPTGSGYFPSGTGSPSGSGYFSTRPAYPTGTGNPSGSGYRPSGTGSPLGSGHFPPTNPSGTGF